MTERLARLWLAAAALLLLGADLDIVLHRGAGLTDIFFREQDLPVLAAMSLVAAPLMVSSALRSRVCGLVARLFEALRGISPGRVPGWVLAGGLAVLTAAIALAGVYVVFENYPLSMDEFFATFDAAIFGHGQTMAPIAPQWRPFAPAMETMFMLPITGHAFWVSAYLPVNSALRALAAGVGAAPLLNPALAALSVVAIFAIGRRLWPERPDLAVVAATLLATSSQFLITAMTPYALTAHLGLNLIWLWLFLRGGRLGHAGAIFVAFLACGLHQLVFHPLFAAPFVLQLWLERRWRTATIYTCAYAAICLFWTLYWPLVLTLSGTSAAASAGLGAPLLISNVVKLVTDFDPANTGIMAKNLIRLMTWQNPLTLPLALLSPVAAVRAKGTLRSLALGLGLTIAAMFILIVYQGHGWGYRYLNGLLGSVCLLAAFQWGQMTDRLDVRGKQVAGTAFIAVAAVSLAVLLPIRALQAHRFVRPYAAAEAAIRHADSQIVLVNDEGIWFGQDLVRNDPYLRNRPLVMNLGVLDENQMRSLCARYTISLFNRADAQRFGIRTFKQSPDEESDFETQLHDACPSASVSIKPRP